MRPKALLAAAAVLALLGAAVWWSNKHKKDDTASTEAPPKILSLAEGDITAVEITRPEGESVRLDRDAGGVWRITAPQPLPTDKDAVSSFLSSAASITADKVIEEKPADLSAFGLARPRAQVTLSLGNGRKRVVKLGDDAPVGGGSFVQVDGDPRVFLLSSYAKGNLDKLAVDFRDKRILTFDNDKVVRIELAAKGPAIEFSKTAQGDWMIIKPQPCRADQWQVDELLRRLRDLKLDPLLTSGQKADLQRQFSSGAAVATLTVTDSAGAQKLEVRKTRDNKYYARSSAVEGFHLLTEDNGKGFEKSLDDFRNKKLFDFGFNDPARIEYKGAKVQLVLSKSGEKWLSGMKPMDPVGVQSLIDRLRELSASSFPSSGFGAPAIEISVTAKTSEKVAISHSGGNYIARREGEPALYELDAKGVEELEKAAAEIKEAPPAGQKQK